MTDEKINQGLDSAAKRQLRITVIGLNYAPETTGIAPYTTGFARHLASEHHAVTVIAGHPHYPGWALHADYQFPRDPEEERGVHLIRIPHPVPANPVGFSRIWMELVYAWRVARQLLRQRPDVVVAVSPALLSLVPAVLLRRFAGYRVGAIVHDLYGAALAETGLGGRLLTAATARLESLLLRNLRGIVVIHEVFRKRLIADGIPEDKITVIPNWSHITMPTTDERTVTRRMLGWGEDEFIALHAGNMGSKQGLEGLLEVARVSGEQDSSVRIVLIGDGSRRKALRLAASGLKHVTFLDPLPDGRFEAALAASDCLLLHEKLGVIEMSVPSKLTTYFAAGQPVIAATNLGSGAAALMREANAGIVVEPGDPHRILDAVEMLRTDPTLAARFGENGRRFAEEHLTGAVSLRLKEAWVRGLAQ